MKFTIEAFNKQGEKISESIDNDSDISYMERRLESLMINTPTAVRFVVDISREDPETSLIKYHIKQLLKSTVGYSFEETTEVLFNELDIKLKEKENE